ncbi:MAG: hypothetical protein ACRDI3_00985, partial [Actinomycetota bacterium]
LKEAPCLVRRADGQVVQLSPLLFEVLAAIDGDRTFESIAATSSMTSGRQLAADDVRYVIEGKLAPAGLAFSEAEEETEMTRSSPLLALRLRVKVIPERVVRAITTVFYPLFWAPVVALVVAAFAALDVWLFRFHGVGAGIYEVAGEPVFILVVIGLTVASVFFHEVGHATACRYGGGHPGGIGVGVYIVWPAFFTDVTDAYRLSKAGRIRTDLGGVYFNAIFSLATAAAYLVTGIEALLLIVVLQHAQMLFQFLPFLRLDGYYLVADLTGVPDLFARIGPTLRGLVPWRRDRRARELKLWVRAVVTLWVVTTIAFLGLMFGGLAVQIPFLANTLAVSATHRLDLLFAALHQSDEAATAVAVFELLALVLPVAGIVVTAVGITRRAAHALALWLRRQTPQTAFATLFASLAGTILLSWWPVASFESPAAIALEDLANEPHGMVPESSSADESITGTAAATTAANWRGWRGAQGGYGATKDGKGVAGSEEPAPGSTPSSSGADAYGTSSSPTPSPSPSPSETDEPSPSSSPSPSPSP